MTVTGHPVRRGPRRSRPSSGPDRLVLGIAVVLAVAGGVATYQIGGPYGEHLRDEPGAGRLYAPDTGLLQMLATDRDGNLWFDMWTHYVDEQPVRSELDQNEDGVIDYWRHYDPDGEVRTVGFSTRGDGVEDAWVHLDAAGLTERVEYSSRRDGVVDRVDHYADGRIVRVE